MAACTWSGSRHGFLGPPTPEVQPEPVPAQPRAADEEVVVKKRALKRVKQQVVALLWGEDLLEGAQAREIAEVPYEGSCWSQRRDYLSCV